MWKTIAADINKLTTECGGLREENTHLKAELDLIKAVVSKQANDIDNLRSDLIDQQARKMRSNVLFHKVPGSKHEVCADKWKIFSKTMATLGKLPLTLSTDSGGSIPNPITPDLSWRKFYYYPSLTRAWNLASEKGQNQNHSSIPLGITCETSTVWRNHRESQTTGRKCEKQNCVWFPVHKWRTLRGGPTPTLCHILLYHIPYTLHEWHGEKESFPNKIRRVQKVSGW